MHPAADRPLKKALRQEILAARNALSGQERSAKSRAIAALLAGLPEYRSAGTVLFFASFRSEVETHDMVRRALTEGKRVVLPKVAGQELALFEIRDFDSDVKPGAWGIPEPASVHEAAREQVDLIFVPGAAFDAFGNRLGYGAGFYDKLLAGFPGSIVAVAFELQIVPQVPSDPHDVPMQKIVTEKRILLCRNSKTEQS